MYWLLLPLAFVTLVLGIRTPSMLMMLVWLGLTVVFLILWVWLRYRVLFPDGGKAGMDAITPLQKHELDRLRAQMQAQRHADSESAQAPAMPGSVPTPTTVPVSPPASMASSIAAPANPPAPVVAPAAAPLNAPVSPLASKVTPPSAVPANLVTETAGDAAAVPSMRNVTPPATSASVPAASAPGMDRPVIVPAAGDQAAASRVPVGSVDAAPQATSAPPQPAAPKSGRAVFVVPDDSLSPPQRPWGE